METERLDFFKNLLQERLERLLQEAGQTLGDLTDDKESLADALDIATMESNRDFQLRIRDRDVDESGSMLPLSSTSRVTRSWSAP